MVLWPRFQVVVDMHIDSVRKAKTKIKPKNVHPHWVRLFIIMDDSLVVISRLLTLTFFRVKFVSKDC